MNSEEPVFSEDVLSNEIYEIHMDVMATQKGYFCILFGHHDAIMDTLSVFIEEGKSCLSLVAKMYGEETPLSELPPELNQTLRELLNRPFEGKPSTKVVRYCRYALLLSCGLSVACFKALEAGDKAKAIVAYGKSEYFLAVCASTGAAFFGEGSAIANASLGAFAKLANDPKQKEKAMVRECWDKWQANPDSYKGNAAFARDMLQKYESLISQQVIERWCRTWTTEASTLPAK